jgi:hypothetical protein
LQQSGRIIVFSFKRQLPDLDSDDSAESRQDLAVAWQHFAHATERSFGGAVIAQAPNTDNKPRRAEFQASSAPVSVHCPEHVWMGRLERRPWSQSVPRREKAAPKQPQNSHQAAPPVHKNLRLSFNNRPGKA